MDNTYIALNISGDLEAIITAAIRYSFGRRTYMPSLICDYVIPLLPVMSDGFLSGISLDFREWEKLSRESWGDDCDFRAWNKLWNAVKTERFNRKERVK